MKEIKLYQCEFCYHQYSDQQLAAECEKNHKIPKKVSACRYWSYEQDESGYPQLIDVVFDNGKTVQYCRREGI